MILGAEIAMLVLGIMALATGRLTLAKTKVVTGPLAKNLAMLLLAPFPLAWVFKGFYDLSYATHGKLVPDPTKDRSYFWTVTAIEGAVVIACLAAVYVIGWAGASDPTAPALGAASDGDSTDKPPSADEPA
jgi:hypothetical protein